MKVPSYLQRNRFGIYVFRRAVPNELKAHIGKREIIYSLRTRDPKEAQRLSRLAALNVDLYFERIERSMSMLHIITKCDCDHTALLRKAINHCIPIFAEVIQCEATILTDIDWGNWDRDSLAHIPARRQNNHKCMEDFTQLSKAELQSLLREKTLTIEILGKEGDKFIYHLDAPQTISLAELYVRQVDYDAYITQNPTANKSGNNSIAPLPTLQVVAELNNSISQIIPAVTKSTNSPTTTQTAQPTTITLSKLIDQYIKDKIGGNKKGYTFPAGHKTKFRRLVEILRDIPCEQVTKSLAREARDCIRKLPSNTAPFRGKTVQEILVKAHTDTLSDKTAKDYFDLYSSLFDWAISERIYSGPNPFKGLAPKDSVAKKDKRSPLTRPELSKIFKGEMFTDYCDKKHKSHLYWAPLITLFTGARNAEVGALKISDIYKDEDFGTWIIDINTKENKTRVKTTNAIRKVPIHSTLIDLGLIDYCNQLHAQGRERLFDHLKWEDKSGYGRYIGEHFNNYLKDIGVHVKIIKVYYSLRHTLATELERQGVPIHRIEMLSGRDPGRSKTTGEQFYIAPAEAPELARDINKIDFSEELKSVKRFQL